MQQGGRTVYDDCEGPRGICVAALVAATANNTTEQISDHGFNTVTTSVKVIASGGWQLPLVGYCFMGNVAGFRLRPPRNTTSRAAWC